MSQYERMVGVGVGVGVVVGVAVAAVVLVVVVVLLRLGPVGRSAPNPSIPPLRAQPSPAPSPLNPFLSLLFTLHTIHSSLHHSFKAEKGEGERPGEGGGSQKEPGEGPGVVDLQRCWGCDEQS